MTKEITRKGDHQDLSVITLNSKSLGLWCWSGLFIPKSIMNTLTLSMFNVKLSGNNQEQVLKSFDKFCFHGGGLGIFQIVLDDELLVDNFTIYVIFQNAV